MYTLNFLYHLTYTLLYLLTGKYILSHCLPNEVLFFKKLLLKLHGKLFSTCCYSVYNVLGYLKY